MSLATARQKDAEDRPLEAIEEFERHLGAADARLSDFLDLAGLYVNALDYGFRVAHKIPLELVDQAPSRGHAVLRLAAERFGADAELSFWDAMLDYVIAFEEEHERRALRALEGRPDLWPLRLLLDGCQPDIVEPSGDIRFLRELEVGVQSTRSRYVASIVESALRKAGLIL